MQRSTRSFYDEKLFDASDLRRSLERLFIINLQVTGFRSSLGLRKREVICIDREDKIVTFVPNQLVEKYLALTLKNWNQDFDKAATLEEVAFTLTQLWMSFITVHPFEDGNGRTIKEFMRQELQKKGLSIKSFDFIDRILMKGNVAEEVPLLEAAFLASIKPSNTMKSVRSLKGV